MKPKSPKLPHAHILGGVVTKYMEFPMLVLFNLKRQYFCGGAIITPSYVLTAGHCFFPNGYKFSKKQLRNMRILIGYGNVTGPEESYRFYNKIKKLILYPTFDGTQLPRRDQPYYKNDIALVKLKKYVNLGKASPFTPICLPAQNQIFKGNVIVAGWGRVREGGRQSPMLLKVVLPIISNSVCNNMSQNYMRPPPYIEDTNICTYYSGGVGACQGDSGGPAICIRKRRMYICGILSFGPGCGSFDVYTKVSSYVNWIEATIEKETKKWKMLSRLFKHRYS